MFTAYAGKRPGLKKAFFFIFALCLVVGAFMPGCSNPASPPLEPFPISLPAALVGEWISPWSEVFEITGSDEFISSYGGSVGYKGPIVNVRDDRNGGGYITIQYTVNAYDAPAIGNYYVIHYKNLAGAGVSFSGSSDGSGKATQAEAESVYTVSNGYFGGYSDCNKIGASGSHSNDIEGEWLEEDEEDKFVITDTTVTYSIDLGASFGGWTDKFVADIVNVRSLGADTGYLTIKYLSSSQANKYSVVYWENLTSTAVDITMPGGNPYGSEGKSTQAEAETAYTVENSSFDEDLWTFDKQ
jgi:hypothetical protein